MSEIEEVSVCLTCAKLYNCPNGDREKSECRYWVKCKEEK